ncbi:RDD family protein [Fodinicola feengrottensis]|uniref:RDD family protein n=1 Tax=Fodinicola feengrottensis TaxID=435914 RepID=UPI0013D111DC|nr:RDD family protein [Fodinicola feengrottensis]
MSDGPPPGYRPPVLVHGHPLAPPMDGRFLAHLIDIAILLLPNLIICTVLFMFVPLGILIAAQVQEPWPYVLAYLGGFSLALLVNLVLLYFYEVGYQVKHGQTYGKKRMGIKIVGLENEQPGKRALQRRFLAQYCVSIVLVIPIVGLLVGSVVGMYNYLDLLWCLWDKPYQQCLHDKYAKTVVIKVAQ